MIWAAWLGGEASVSPVLPAVGVPTLWLGYLCLVLGLALWSHRVVRRIDGYSGNGPVARFQRAVWVGRLVVLCWYVVGLYVLGWGDVVRPMANWRWPIETPATLLAIAPPLLAWMGFWVAQYPVDRAVREQNVLARLDDGHPIHAPPGFWDYLVGQLRLQVLFWLVPVVVVMVLRDLLRTTLVLTAGQVSELAEGIIGIGTVAFVFLTAPVILRHVLPTQRLPDGELRQRLDATCRRLGLRYRELLVWRTHHNLANAAVAGLIPQVRYILLSDLLLETMSDRQIEAVFAHEAGHVVHKHLAWYVLFFVLFAFVLGGVDGQVTPLLIRLDLPGWIPWSLLSLLCSAAALLLCFGSLSRSFERQADVFAARSLTPEPSPLPPVDRPVETYGAELMSSALIRVARINNMPIDPPGRAVRSGLVRRVRAFIQLTADWWHGSIRSRIDYLHQISGDTHRTAAFDRRMLAVRLSLVCAFCATVAWVAVSALRGASL